MLRFHTTFYFPNSDYLRLLFNFSLKPVLLHLSDLHVPGRQIHGAFIHTQTYVHPSAKKSSVPPHPEHLPGTLRHEEVS